MKKIILAAFVTGIMFALTACGQDMDSPIVTINSVEFEEEVPTPEPTDKPIPTLNPGGETNYITKRVEKDGMMQSYLTGEWNDVDVVERRNMAVMIPNNTPALPQYGISQASIIFEAPVEGRITRLMGIFEDYDNLEKIGPVRSARDYYLYESMAYDSIYVNWGLAVPFVGPVINTTRVDNISQAVYGIDVAASEAFGRVSRPGYSTEFTGYLFIDGYNDAVNRLKYKKTYEAHDRFEQAFTFADEGYAAMYDSYEDATEIYPGGNTSNKGGYGTNRAHFKYDEKTRLYYRYQYGDAQIDEYNDEQLAVTNVIFKICHGEIHEPVEKDYMAFEVHGKGDAYIFTNGKVIEGSWKRKDDYSPNMFYDENGDEIVFNQGKTWICLIWDDYAEYISYE